MNSLLAIDPGLGGAVAFLFPEITGRVSVYDMPTVDGEVNAHALADLIRQHAPSQAIIEQVGPMPRDGVRQAWRFGAAFATAKTVIIILELPLITVAPSVWKKALHIPGGPQGKEAARATAIRLYPACAMSFAHKCDHNKAEAALLARYAAETMFPRNAMEGEIAC